jgi:transcriptional regulator with AAA-type ATPase domain/tetratricopeptide (TPR) repeat protein
MGFATSALLGEAPQIAALRTEIERLAAFDGPGNPHVPTVLLQGETGTGKGQVARIMHGCGPRAAKPLIDVNCAAIPEAMLEAELFGFEAGAFTDAKRAKPGLFEAASGGTLFLDEIDSLSLPVQSKVLKAIEEKRVRRLGAVDEHAVDVKLIAASQKDLPALVACNQFRADLYHRLAVLVFVIPPLRERRQDVLLLAQHFLHAYASAHGLADKRLIAGAVDWLLSHRWPGNVRELSNLMERVTLLFPGGEVGAETLAALANPGTPAAPVSAGMEERESGDDDAGRIRAALARTGGNVLRAAKLLGIGRNALRYRMRRLGIEREDSEAPPARPPAAASAPRATAPRRAPAWERKSVTVLTLAVTFSEADAAGYEPWTAATRWDRVIEDTVVGFGGVFVEHSPSRSTAVFGVPRALEQAPLRAVRAALAIQREVAQASSPRPDIHAAVHLGEVRVDAAADDPKTGVRPIGDVFTLPERLLGHAGSGEVLVSPSVARRVERECRLQPRALQLGPHAHDRLDAHVAVGARPAGTDAVAEDAPPTPFVGREREIALLMDAFEQAAGGHGQVVFIAGDAGIGKSRLLGEFRRRVRDSTHRWVEGRCASYGSTTPLLPINDGLRRYLSINDDDSEAVANEKIEAFVATIGHDLLWTVPYLRQVLSLEVGDEAVRGLDSASRRSEMFRALSTIMLRAAQLEPRVIVVEDLHWIDPTSEDYLAFIADLIPAARVLLLLSHRPGYSHPFGDRSYHRRITLPPLSGDDMAAVTQSILGAADVPESLRALIANKAEGNPFFVEELTRSLLEEGALRRENGRIVLARAESEITVPDTIQAVLLARIDRLAEDAKHAIQVASVIGREFALRLLARITDAGDRVRTHVEELRGLELVYEKTLHPELAYMFKHALTHDVAYGSVVEERRRALHRTIGLAIEELYADRLAEHYETLAYHFSRGDDLQRAFRYHERSAEKAAETYANRAVIEHARRALEVAERLGSEIPAEARARLYEQLGSACFCLSEYAASGQAYDQAVALASDSEVRSLRLAAAGLSYFWAHQYEPAKERAAALLDLGRGGVASADAQGKTVIGVYDGVIEGDLASCERHITEAWAITAQHPNEVVEAFIGQHAVFLAEWTGAYGQVTEIAERTIPLGRKRKLPLAIVFPTWFLAKSRCCTGDYAGALALLREAYEFCDRIGDRAWRSRLLNTLGWCYAEIGDDEGALTYNERAAAVARDVGDPEILSNAHINLAANHLALGRGDEALRHLEPIESTLSRPGDKWMRWRYALHARHVRACYQLERRQPEKALAMATKQLEGAQAHRAPKIEARALTQQASALLALERREMAEAALRQALAIADRIGYRRGAWEARFLLAETLHRNGDDAAAKAQRAKGWQIVDFCGRSLDEETRRHLFRRALLKEAAG